MSGSNVAEPTAELTYTISELASEFGVTARAIRFYEDKNLLQPRRNGTARIYERRDRGRLELILRGKRLGFSLSDISEMLDLYDPHGEGREQLKVTLAKSRQRLAALEQQRRDIDDVIEELRENCSQISARLDK
ncbi:MAG: MerR family DNA-binding transcriptional regulator [Rhodospirillaceae bacterium]|jgi:DNA-binding transcriptional MerR regulator|nr:MerR family DNA-binding transcriptional regulator [Rhodospirillaceae bacterium]MBT4486576.1 MerR family DNA-binding transcriptional regulator [Rhodospirillaceae bacterium]MBT5193346.1 MerR family DNA-binding transcriptional regulator [Rhodospirillaceae bacterium]MBT5897594.1 MerR family DNA-binding transcriptional regulator [Rhodospirillaceae bacterium]MBT6427619.1 MerR family DNA-binding transcriptional regulator [Rhodospirillaceae bacterium]